MRLGRQMLITSIMTATLPQAAFSQDTQPRLTFDVVAIHPSLPDATGGVVKPLPNGTGYTVQNMTAKTMMATMYRIPARQIEGGPDWFGSDRFDVEARADRGSYSIDELHTMFKDLLKDRFGLEAHVDTREGPVYILTVARGGTKMKADGSKAGLSIPMMPTGPGRWTGTKVPMEYLCWFLGQISPDDMRPVIDRTGLKDVYDFELSFTPEQPPGVSPDGLPPELRNLPVLRDALEEQLGLVLKPAKGPVKYYVIDHVDKPSAN
ncbi:MAG: TIGR03435 family protein [Terracidiphilus sp.]